MSLKTRCSPPFLCVWQSTDHFTKGARCMSTIISTASTANTAQSTPGAVRRRTIPFGRPLIGDEERAAVQEALSSPQLVHGPRAHAFEHAFAASLGPQAHATSVSSCTAGLHLVYMH